MLQPRNIGTGCQTGVIGGYLAYILNALAETPNMSFDSSSLDRTLSNILVKIMTI